MRGHDTSLRLFTKTAAIALALAAAPMAAQAEPGHGKSYGKPGKASQVDRTVEVEAEDIDFGHDEIQVKPGQTVRFVVTNTGKMPHEFTIGPPSVQKQHRKEMEAMMQSGGDGHGHSGGHGDGHGGGHGDGHHGDGHHGDDHHAGGHSDGHGGGHGGGHGSGHGGGHADASGHGHANSVMVGPGETKELIWHFEHVDDVQFGCNVPGHYEAGMHGRFVTAG